ncbi:hypothetical protein M9458_056674 [Cirrhinus mrigala]|uniref:Reverse transcriptase n=1 Tax=Cirrhinus mrigala TaxID=683832 RepID=A0ABD0MEF5_CIRMR
MGGAASRCRPRPYERTGVVHSHPALSPSVWMLLWLHWIPGHPHTDLYQRLLIIDRFRALGVRHRDVVLAHMKVLGLRLNAKKSVLSPLQRTTYLGVVWDLTTMQTRLSPARIESILTAVVRVRKGRSLAVKQFQQLLGLMAAVSNVIPFGLLYMRPLQWWLRTKRFSPRGNPFHTSRSRGDTYVPWTCGGSLGSCLIAPCCRVMLATDASLTGWGAVMDGHPAHGLWSDRRLTWHITAWRCWPPPCAGAHQQHSGGLLHQPPGRSASRPLYKLVHQILAWSQDKLLSLRAVHIPGHLNLGADILPRQGPRPGEWMLHPEVVKQIWRVFCQAQVDLFVRVALSTGAGCHGTDVAEASSVRLSPIPLLPGVLERVRYVFPSPEYWKLWVKLYALKWKPFTSWCGDRQQDSVNCPVGTVLGFLQDRFSTGLAQSTVKVYLAAISAYHAPLGGSSVGRNPLVTRFLRAFSTQLEFLKGNVSGYVCNHGSLRERDAASRAILPGSLQRLLLYPEAAGCMHLTCF